MTGRCCRILTLIVGFACLVTRTTADARMPPATLPDVVERVIGWLPHDTETLIVARGAFRVPLFVPNPDPTTEEDVTFLERARLLPARLLLGSRDGLLTEDLEGSNVLLAVEGSRRFRAPARLGMMPYEGCQIVQFDKASHDVVQRAFRACLERAPETIRVAGAQVAVFEKRWEEDVWTLLVVQPEPGMLLCATDRGYLETVLQRRERPAQVRALPKDLPEWWHVDVGAPVWAVRHYRAEGAEEDPSSPLRGQAAANVPDAQAVGFVFWYDDAERIAEARYLSRSPDSVRVAGRGWHHWREGLTPEIEWTAPGVLRDAPGVVAISASVHDLESRRMFLFVLLAYLGHAAYI